ncbi:unannotated protein [freshwater metagenome]|uniref:Unannotated protein n=1 Tax=freshwater metagenome TaxID=449393 RepID=A0A6J6X0F6_9ZZZZ
MSPRYVQVMKLRPVLFGVIVGAVVAASVTAWATIPDSNTGAVAACSNKYGTIRLIDAQAGKKCKRTEKKLTLGARGATGPAGPGLLVKDGNGNIVGQYVDGDVSSNGGPGSGGSLIVLGPDRHLRLYYSDGTYGLTGDVSGHSELPTYWFSTSDCSGIPYVPKFEGFPSRQAHDQWGLALRLKQLDGSYLSLDPSRYGEIEPAGFAQVTSYWGAEMDGDLYTAQGWGCHPKSPSIQNYLTNLGFGVFIGFHSRAVSDFSVGPDLVPPLSVVPAP